MWIFGKWISITVLVNRIRFWWASKDVPEAEEGEPL